MDVKPFVHLLPKNLITYIQKKKKKDSKFSKNLQLEKDKEKSTKPSIHLSNQSPIMDYLLLHEPIQLVSCK